MISLAYAIEQDAEATPNATDFIDEVVHMASRVPVKERAAFIAGAIKAAELCGHSVFAWHLANRMNVDPWGE